MVTWFEEHGFVVAAEILPESCTACPFWLLDMATLGKGECYITGHIIDTYGQQDEKRMDDCPIIQRKEEQQWTTKKK